MIKLLLKMRKVFFFQRISAVMLRIRFVDIPHAVKVGSGLILPHNGIGVVVHPTTVIGNNVRIYQNVTIGRADIWNDVPSENFIGAEIHDNAILCAGAKIIVKSKITVGTGTVIGANSVLTKSTGQYEIWAGVPAKKIGNLNERNIVSK